MPVGPTWNSIIPTSRQSRIRRSKSAVQGRPLSWNGSCRGLFRLCRYGPLRRSDQLPSRLVRFRRVLLWLTAMGVAGTTWAAVLVIELLDRPRPLLSGVAQLVGAVLVLPPFATGLAANRRMPGSQRHRRAAQVEFLSSLPKGVLILAAGLFFAFCSVPMIATGDPEIHDGQYVLNKHGTFTVVDRATFERASAADERSGLATFGGFGVVGATICLSTFRLRR